MVPLLLFWGLFAWIAYGLYSAGAPPELKVYDPREILGISSSATEKQIKKHYRKLSLQYHPDKIKLGVNETMEEAESKFIEITKAYKSLTDETIRENLEKYGNPDGPQQREDKIAIPKWVVEGKSSAWVLAAYGIVLGLGIPFIVGRWWFRQRRLTRDGILNGTAEIFFHSLRQDIDFLSIISLLASALEFESVLATKKVSKKQRKERQARIEELEKVLEEKRVALNIDESPTMRKDSRVIVTTAVARRARALLWAHLLRVKLEPELEREQLEVLRVTPPLIQGLSNIALGFTWLDTSLLCLKLQSALVQAIPIGASPLAQFPDISLEEAQDMEILTNSEGRLWLEKWVRRDVDGLAEAKKVAKTWPRLDITSTEFKVVGEKVVTPGSIVSLIVKARYVYPTTPISSATNGGAAREESVEVVEGSVEAADGEAKVEEVNEKSPIPSRSASPKVKSVITPAKPSKPTGYIHAPHWPANRAPSFQVMLGDSKLDKVIVPPTRFTDIPMPNADGTPAEPKEFTIQLPAPPQPNLYSFVAYLTSDALVGADVSRPIMVSFFMSLRQNQANICFQLKVEPVADEEDSDDDISDPEEDSLAGQMALMRGGKVKASDVYGDDDSEYETDTSSDEDTPRAGRAINEDTDSDSD